MHPASKPPGVKTWLLLGLLGEVVPVGLLYGVSCACKSPLPIRDLVGYSAVLLLAMGIMFAVISDLLVEQHWPGNALFICGLLLIVCLTLSIGVGTYADVLEKVEAKKQKVHPGELTEALDVSTWLVIQVLMAISVLCFCAVAKAFLLNHQREALAAVNQECGVPECPRKVS